MKKYSLKMMIIIIGVFFLSSGIIKLLDPIGLSRNMQNYKILAHPYSLVVGITISWLEIYLSVALFFKRWRVNAVKLLVVMIIFFEIILCITIVRGIDINCGCFGNKFEQSVMFAFLRNIIILVILLVVYFNRDWEVE